MTTTSPLVCDENARQPVETNSWQPPGALGRLARDLLFRALARLSEGELTIQDGSRIEYFGRPSADKLAATITIHDQAFYRRVLCGGSIGAAESFMGGEWTTDNLTAVVRLMTRNATATGNLERVARWLMQPLLRIQHALRRNNHSGARRNIAAHYDLGNEFFAAWLDPTLAYSSGIYEHPAATLHEAQLAKFERLCRLLDLQPNERLFEIGCGWGGLAIYAASHFGCRVTAVTISRRQFELASERVRQAGLANRVEVLLQDYRTLRGNYDKLVSVEMIEAVGRNFLPQYFETCSRLLAPDGMMALQGITIADQLYDRYCRSVDFIQRYIFPGGHLPSLGSILDAIRRTNFRLASLENRPHDYARTLAAWREGFLRELPSLQAAGFPAEFLRMWEFYFAYCEGGFREEQIGLAQLVFAKPRRAIRCSDDRLYRETALAQPAEICR